MKLVLTLLALIALSGCTTYVTRGGEYASEFDARECRYEARHSPNAPTAAEAFTPGGMDRAAVKLEQLTDACMARLGHRRAGSA